MKELAMVGFRGLRLSVDEATDILLAQQREAQQLRSATASTQPGSLSSHPQAQSIEELRRQQAAFRAVRSDLDRENWWMAIPALAPAAAVMTAEAAAAIAGRMATPMAAAGPLALVKRDPVPRVGDHWGTRKGRRAHAAHDERVKQKPGWKAQPQYPGIRPDTGTPVRNPAAPQKRYLLELKPDTPSGRRAGARQVKRYTEQTGNKARVIYYDPNDF